MKENEEIATELQEDLFGQLKQETEKEKLFQRKSQYNKIDCVRGGLRREIEMSNNIFVNDLISDLDLNSDDTSFSWTVRKYQMKCQIGLEYSEGKVAND